MLLNRPSRRSLTALPQYRTNAEEAVATGEAAIVLVDAEAIVEVVEATLIGDPDQALAAKATLAVEDIADKVEATGAVGSTVVVQEANGGASLGANGEGAEIGDEVKDEAVSDPSYINANRQLMHI